MSYLTLAQARQALWKYTRGANDTRVAFESADAADYLSADTAINLTIERFLTLGRWRGDTVRARFRVYNNTITLPSNLLCVIGATPIRDTDDDEDQVGMPPYGIYAMEHEFKTSGPGNVSPSSLFGLIDLGDNFPTFIDPAGEFYLRVVSSRTESGQTILLKGLDEDFTQIYTAGVEGVNVDIDPDPGNTTTQVFSQISQWQKSDTTEGVVRIYSVDTTSAEEQLLVVIPPGKTTSGYHRYRVPDGDWGDTIEALCKRAYVPAIADNDLIIPGNLGALKLGLMSLQFEDRNDRVNAKAYMQDAFDLLNSELQQFAGDAVIPTMQMVANYGGSTIPNIS